MMKINRLEEAIINRLRLGHTLIAHQCDQCMCAFILWMKAPLDNAEYVGGVRLL